MPATVVGSLAVRGQTLRKALLEGLHSLQEQKERIDGLIATTLKFAAPPLLAIEPFALHEHWVPNLRSTFDIVKDMLHGDAYISQVPYLTTEEILERENLYQEHETDMAVKLERWLTETTQMEREREASLPPGPSIQG
ncbi:hypothetical protein EAF04_008177 [Stromatinia cepivora]|nr:hypothetical protein EAF04_008177 [Stromatinia cepivora]